MDELMIVAISRGAQLAYLEEAPGAFAYLSAADRFFRYHASRDRTATLAQELEVLADLATIDGSFTFEVAGAAEAASLFIPRLSLVEAALGLASMPGPGGRILIEIGGGEEGPACLLSRGGERRPVARA